MPGRWVARYPGTRNRSLVWITDRACPNGRMDRVNSALAAQMQADKGMRGDPLVRGLVDRVRSRIAAGQLPHTDDLRMLSEVASATLISHGNAAVRAEAARLLASMAKHEDKMRLGVMQEQGANRRHRETLESRKPAPGPGLPGQALGAGVVVPRLLKPR